MKTFKLIIFGLLLCSHVSAQKTIKKIDNLIIPIHTGYNWTNDKICQSTDCKFPFYHAHHDVDFKRMGDYYYIISDAVSGDTLYRDSLEYVNYQYTGEVDKEFWYMSHLGLSYNSRHSYLGKEMPSVVTLDKFEEGNEWGPTPSWRKYQYDEHQNLTSIILSLDEEKKNEWKLQWEDGNIVSGTFYFEGKPSGTFNCEYYDKECDNQAAIYSTPLYSLMRYFFTIPTTQLLEKFYGNLCNNYLKSIKFNFSENDKKNLDWAIYYYYEEKPYMDHEYTYEFDNEGYPIKIIDTLNNHEMQLEWETPTAINSSEVNQSNRNKSNGIFDLQGRRLTEEPEKGIFIENGVKRVK